MWCLRARFSKLVAVGSLSRWEAPASSIQHCGQCESAEQNFSAFAGHATSGGQVAVEGVGARCGVELRRKIKNLETKIHQRLQTRRGSAILLVGN
jgi:hypothetical protein